MARKKHELGDSDTSEAIESGVEPKTRTPRTPREPELIKKGALSMTLADRIDLRKALDGSIAAEVADLKAQAQIAEAQAQIAEELASGV